MAYKISDTGFFKRGPMDRGSFGETDAQPGTDFVQAEEGVMGLGEEIERAAENCRKALKEAGLSTLCREAELICKRALQDRFSVAVVGEFSRGKSTFINRFLDKELLPVGNLPTTAVMTRIRYSEREVIAGFDRKNRKVFERPLSEDCWEDLVIKNFGGQEFEGRILAGVNSEWLKKNSVELIDTPGAGDLNEARAKLVGEALLGCDGAIITVNATCALSMSERLFIEERLIARRVPFLMLIITKLDLVPFGERVRVIRYVREKLADWGMDIPVYVPYPVELEEPVPEDIMGMDKIKNQIRKWTGHQERVRVMEQWVLAKLADVLDNGISALSEQKRILEASRRESLEKLLCEKEDKLARAKLEWGDLRLQMEKRCTECYRFFLDQAEEQEERIIERLQYEASHANNPQKWWKEDLPYRLKLELTNMGAGIDRLVSAKAAEDARWYGEAIEKTFHASVLFCRERISDKEIFEGYSIKEGPVFQDLAKQRNAVRIGSAVLSISGAVLLSTLGFMPLIATMGIGTGTAIFSDNFFKKKSEEQKERLKQEIARRIPGIIQEGMEQAEERLRALYASFIGEADKSQQKWLESQREAMKAAKAPRDEERYEAVCAGLARLEQERSVLKERIEKY